MPSHITSCRLTQQATGHSSQMVSRFNNGVYHDWWTMEINARGLLQAKLHPLAVAAPSIIFSWRTKAIFGFGRWPTFVASPIPRSRCIVVGRQQQHPIIRIVSNTNLVAFAFTRQWSEIIEHPPAFDVLSRITHRHRLLILYNKFIGRRRRTARTVHLVPSDGPISCTIVSTTTRC